ncbi:uncharacterized protein LACBIDRAFT_314373 [Laccaria bicolor S238N-H82]|uniref:Predicted protein n=1 Tax=Laccaria bicolor (strain S238N-H82 / ATCC MYA-4686) TaxID=486041 RepID=B0DWY8_LACBS|nr:uncharacterized protein LACBIDRAFT_312858 [Laccaria bicolor S238N-H82]XP_001888980.1 uncharacterized protein LACBIDRAFT_314373 [Laccaria bicolor S238N-H82]EDR00421.1 predicted protein [Laccaria bicolor S238N-H82]EDR00895.1 predicted protein [Laccaria bicolor S238N-H82]|eukprot:XP_001888489.1 predicted protein [Laccaria bicolor S238N-H82]
MTKVSALDNWYPLNKWFLRSKLNELSPPSTTCLLPLRPLSSFDDLFPLSTNCLLHRRPVSAFDELSPPSTTCFRLRRTVSSINDPPPSFDECLLASPPIMMNGLGLPPTVSSLLRQMIPS